MPVVGIEAAWWARFGREIPRRSAVESNMGFSGLPLMAAVKTNPDIAL